VEYNEYLEFIASENNRYNNEKDPELSKILFFSLRIILFIDFASKKLVNITYQRLMEINLFYVISFLF